MEERVRILELLILMGVLGIYGWEDIKKHRITVWYLVLAASLGVGFRIYEKNLSWPEVLLGLLVGVGVLLLAIVSRERIGIGDGLLLMVTGIYLGGGGNLQLFMNGLLFAAMFSLAVLVFRKWKRNREIPFVPFLFLGYIVIVVEELL